MSLFSTLQIASNTLRAAQVGLQVTGQNIANANTPGYIREEVVYAPAPVQRVGNLTLGLGVEVDGIVQKLDKFVLERLRGAISDLSSATIQEETHRNLEEIIAELGENDLSTSFSNFVSSIHEVLNQPESEATRNLAVLRGQALADDIQRMGQRARKLRSDANTQVEALAGEINLLSEEIATLNVRIQEVEGGASRRSDAGALRDQRNLAIERLAEIVDIRVHEQETSAVNISIGGETLIFEAQSRKIEISEESDRGQPVAVLNFEASNSPVQASAGILFGLYESRDTVLGGFIDSLNDLSQTLITEFNQDYARGQGLTGFHEVSSEHLVDDPSAPLDAAGLNFAPHNGAFDVLIRNAKSGVTTTHRISVDLNGFDEDTSLESLAADLDAIDGLAATVHATGRLSLKAESQDIEFAFSGDSSGTLAALGINTFFSGTGIGNIGVSDVLKADAGKFAASRGGVAADTENAVELARFFDRALDSQSGASLNEVYQQLTNEVTQGTTVAGAVTEGLATFEQTLRGNHLAATGVNLDEEAIELVTLQQLYQASARFIRTIADLLEILVAI